MAHRSNPNIRLFTFQATMFISLVFIGYGMNYLYSTDHNYGSVSHSLPLETSQLMPDVEILEPIEEKISFVEYEHSFIAEREQDFSVTVVSLFFQLAVSKHTNEEYDRWLKNFCKSVTAPLVMFVNQPALEKLLPLRKGLTTKFYVVNDTWTIFRALEIERNQSYIQNYQEKQHALDREAHIHNKDLYTVWNAKPYLLYKVSQLNPFASRFFICTDSGSFRHQVFENWPYPFFINEQLAPKLNHRMLFGHIHWRGTLPDVLAVIEGTFYCGSGFAVQQFYRNFFQIHDERMSQGLFVGKDQDIMEQLVFRRFNHTAVRLQTWNLPACSFNYDPWFLFQYYFSKDLEKYRCGTNRLQWLIEPGRYSIDKIESDSN